jgi:hypothetical protein
MVHVKNCERVLDYMVERNNLHYRLFTLRDRVTKF